MLRYEESKVATRRKRKGFLSLSSGKKKIHGFSVRYRSAILFIKLKEQEIITPFEEKSSTKIIRFLSQNEKLVFGV